MIETAGPRDITLFRAKSLVPRNLSGYIFEDRIKQDIALSCLSGGWVPVAEVITLRIYDLEDSR